MHGKPSTTKERRKAPIKIQVAASPPTCDKTIGSLGCREATCPVGRVDGKCVGTQRSGPNA